ncbi:MAG: tRNA (guanosine(37)-N1)-methyltransferase TrmD [Microbacteriaceae bacterium]
MRIDIVTIFPEFFGPLEVSLIGKAHEKGLVTFTVHDLRDFTFDRHKTVDDSPYGGGAGMVMKAEPWGLALDSVLSDVQDGEKVCLIFTSPAGEVFKQATAREFAGVDRLIFACGRYEGIDERVVDHYAERQDIDVRKVSIGDYVLNGGEVAALAIIEAVGRLVPGVIGNPESLVEESHEDGLLEYPSYTKPQEWRGLQVPDVLRGGNHAEIQKWRHAQQIERTRTIRPDMRAE